MESQRHITLNLYCTLEYLNLHQIVSSTFLILCNVHKVLKCLEQNSSYNNCNEHVNEFPIIQMANYPSSVS